MPWCAINPWNGLLYSSKTGEPPTWDGETFTWVDNDPVNEVYCYDPLDNNFGFRGSLTLLGKPLHQVSGGCFSKNGHLYLVSDYTEDIHAYSAFNGAFLGSCHVPYDKGGIAQEEMEGITLGHIIHADGVSTDVHVLILDNEGISRDDVYLKNFAVPDPSVI